MQIGFFNNVDCLILMLTYINVTYKKISNYVLSRVKLKKIKSEEINSFSSRRISYYVITSRYVPLLGMGLLWEKSIVLVVNSHGRHWVNVSCGLHLIARCIEPSSTACFGGIRVVDVCFDKQIFLHWTSTARVIYVKY